MELVLHEPIWHFSHRLGGGRPGDSSEWELDVYTSGDARRETLKSAEADGLETAFFAHDSQESHDDFEALLERHPDLEYDHAGRDE